MVAVKAPPIRMRGEIPERFLALTREFFGPKAVQVIAEDSDRLEAVEKGEFYKTTKAKMAPGDYMRVLREIRGMTQTELGKLLGGVPRQNVSAMETGRRALSKATIKKIAKIFSVSPARFL